MAEENKQQMGAWKMVSMALTVIVLFATLSGGVVKVWVSGAATATEIANVKNKIAMCEQRIEEIYAEGTRLSRAHDTSLATAQAQLVTTAENVKEIKQDVKDLSNKIDTQQMILVEEIRKLRTP